MLLQAPYRPYHQRAQHQPGQTRDQQNQHHLQGEQLPQQTFRMKGFPWHRHPGTVFLAAVRGQVQRQRPARRILPPGHQRRLTVSRKQPQGNGMMAARQFVPVGRTVFVTLKHQQSLPAGTGLQQLQPMITVIAAAERQKDTAHAHQTDQPDHQKHLPEQALIPPHDRLRMNW